MGVTGALTDLELLVRGITSGTLLFTRVRCVIGKVNGLFSTPGIGWAGTSTGVDAISSGGPARVIVLLENLEEGGNMFVESGRRVTWLD